jgi:hypothetical protein
MYLNDAVALTERLRTERNHFARHQGVHAERREINVSSVPATTVRTKVILLMSSSAKRKMIRDFPNFSDRKGLII